MQPDRKNTAPTAQTRDGYGADKTGDGDWLKRARAAYETSTTYVDGSMRKGWDDSIKAFNNQHPGDSKYNNPAYDKRSHLYRPKLRSVIRKNEAAAAAAFFSNIEVVDITPGDDSNKINVASSEVMKKLMQYRLSKSIPWFQILLGGLQDAQSVGVVCAHIYWDYKKGKQVVTQPVPMAMATSDEAGSEEYPEQSALPEGTIVADGEHLSGEDAMPTQATQQPVDTPKPLSDKPCIDLIPVENIRIDPSAKWTDPINTSPYVIELIPMYAMDVKEKIEVGEWRNLSDGVLRAGGETQPDSTRSTRSKDRADQYDSANKELMDYEIIWVQRHIHRRNGEDWEFYVLGDLALLSDPHLLKETVFHGKRPYVMGCCILETHKVYPTSVPQLGRGLADEANEVTNTRLDNVKFVLNKKYFVKRGKDVDIGGLLRNVPGGVVTMEDPEKDVKESTWPDVTASAYEEQGRIDNDMNDLVGNFSPAQVMADHGINGPARNMQILSQSSGTLVEYLLLTYVYTFAEPVLRQLMLLEQNYETDEVIIALAAKQAKVAQRFGIDQVTDHLLEQELMLTVNVGMGATDPGLKLQKFLAGMSSYNTMAQKPAPGLNLQEVGKEIFGHLGYSDGSRFFTNDNPQVAALEQKIKEMEGVMQQLQSKANDKMAGHQVRVATVQHTNETKVKTTQIHEENENLRASIIHTRALVEAEKQHNHEAMMEGIKQRHMSQADTKPKGKGNSDAATKDFKIVKRTA